MTVDPDAYQQLSNRLARVQRHRRTWARRRGITCWRVYEKDIADQPLIVDWYDGDAVCWAFPRTRNQTPADEVAWLAAVQEAIGGGLAIDAAHLHLKRRDRQADRQHGGQYQRLGDAQGSTGTTRVVVEAGLRFEVNLDDYLDTGLFLDHRPLRAVVGAAARDRDLLNLFCYTGAFTCHAAAGGAASTTSVDLSNTYLAWAARNLALNGVGAGTAHALVRADALGFLAETAATPRRFDLIVCDPPTFSNSTAMRTDFAVDRDHVAVITACVALLRPGGSLWFSSNSRALVLDIARLPALTEISAQTVPDDFRNRRIHRCWRYDRPV